jgi:MFS transporter, FHS family, glucose/mannose:H+ symporter
LNRVELTFLNPAAIAETAMDENPPVQREKSVVSSWQRQRSFVILLHAGFLLIGVVTTLLGPILPMLAIKWSLDDAELGLFFTAQFTGAIIGSAWSSRVIVRTGLLRLMVCGYAAAAGAVACLTIASWLIGLVAAFSAGVALGLTAPAINLLVAQINPERPAAAVNILNFAWAIGAVAGPPMIAFFGRDGHLTRPLVGLAVLLSCVAFLTARRGVVDFAFASDHQPMDTRFARSALRAWATPYALLTGVLIFIYVGTETATSGWIATYALRLGESSNGFETLMPSVFWGGLLIGRALAPVILNRVTDTTLVLSGLLLAGSGLLLIILGADLLSVACGVGLTGLGLASVFPTTFAIFAHHFGEQASQMTGFFFVVGGLGGALVPWLVGVVSEGFNDLRAGIFVPSVGVALMVVLQAFIIAVLGQGSDAAQEGA